MAGSAVLLARFSLLVNITAKGLKLAICKAATGFGQLRSLIAFLFSFFFWEALHLA